MKLGESNTIFSWSANSVVNIPILFAMAGFIFSIAIFKGGCNKIDFHEIYLGNKNELIEKTLTNRITKLKHLSDSLHEYSFIPANSPDSIKNKNATFLKAQKSLSYSLIELQQLKNSKSDTSLKYFAQYISANSDSLKAAINTMQENDKTDYTRRINVLIKDTCAVLSDLPFLTNDTLVLKYNRTESLMIFFDEYSLFGFWFFFSMAQMTLWFLLIPLIIGAVKRTDKIQLAFNLSTGLLFSIIPALLVGFFTYLFYHELVDTYVIEDSFFLEAYNSKMIFYSIPGYIVAVLCFSSYLFLSNNLELLDSNSANSVNPQDDFKKLTTTFNFTFLCSAIVLSVFVFWVGILFNAINNTEAMSFYKLQSGKPFLNYDFVYLLGLMHTLLLFIFYVPVRIRFNKLDIAQQQRAIVANNPSTPKFWNNLLDFLSPVLLTTSPLITTFIQKLINMFS